MVLRLLDNTVHHSLLSRPNGSISKALKLSAAHDDLKRKGALAENGQLLLMHASSSRISGDNKERGHEFLLRSTYGDCNLKMLGNTVRQK